MPFVLSDVAMSLSEADGDSICMSKLTVGSPLLSTNKHGIKKDIVSWIGGYRVTVEEHLPDVLAGYPVRIRNDAIADRIPYADLLLTSNHEIVIDDLFIPIRCLVNGISIYFDTQYVSYIARSFSMKEAEIAIVNGLSVRTKS